MVKLHWAKKYLKKNQDCQPAHSNDTERRSRCYLQRLFEGAPKIWSLFKKQYIDEKKIPAI